MGDWLAGEPALVRYCCRAGAYNERQVRTQGPLPGSPESPPHLSEQRTWGPCRKNGPLSPARAWGLMGTCLQSQLPGVGAADGEPGTQPESPKRAVREGGVRFNSAGFRALTLTHVDAATFLGRRLSLGRAQGLN